MADRLRFEWDQSKDIANQTKHRISFTEARTVFLDENGRLIADPEHSVTEDRFLLLGMSARFRLLVVSHCYREDGSIVRIISVRSATRNEQKEYMENLS